MKPAPQPIILAAIDRMRVLRRERELVAHAEGNTILSMVFVVDLGAMPLVEDGDVPPRRVRYYDRRGRMVSEVAC